MAWNTAVALLAWLEGEDHAAKSSVDQVVLVVLARRKRSGRDGEIAAQNRIARHAICCGTQGSGTFAIVDIAQHLRYTAMSATDAVGHLHLGHVDILCACAQLFAAHSVLDEGSIGDVGRRKPKRHVRTHGLLLVGRLALHHLLPLLKFVKFLLVVLAEVAADSFH